MCPGVFFPAGHRHVCDKVTVIVWVIGQWMQIIASMSLTQQWLRDKAASYSAADRVYSDIDAALVRFPTLRPKLDVYST